MEVIVNYPQDEEGKKELSKVVAELHATLVMKAVDDLNLDRESRKKLLKALVEHARQEMLEEQRMKKEMRNKS